MPNDELYREDILEHYRHPQNFGQLKAPRRQAYRINPLCGDEIDLQVKFGKSGKVEKVAFSGSGCALSVAAASLLTEWMKGKSRSELKKMRPDQAEKLLSVKVTAARRKCVLLPYDALREIADE